MAQRYPSANYIQRARTRFVVLIDTNHQPLKTEMVVMAVRSAQEVSLNGDIEEDTLVKSLLKD
jgi:hypothetical protein